MGYLLNIVYALVLAIAAPWLAWQSWRTGKYREGWRAKFLGQAPERNDERPCLWLHAVSVGEVYVLAPIIERWERLHPDWEIVISTTTRAGHEAAQKRYGPRTVFFCPLDFTWAVKRAVRAVRPDLLVLAELELWPNLIHAARQQGAKIAVINGRLGEKSFRGYERIRWLIRRALQEIDLVAVQNESYAARFRQLGASPAQIHVTGSIKFDGARTDRNNVDSRRLAKLAGFKPEDVVFLAGSTQAPEEELVIQAFRELSPHFPALRLALVPRHPERFDEVAALLERSGIRWQRRSKIDQSPIEQDRRVLLVDAVGELAAWWGTATIGFVGGSLGNRGGQNMIEPSAYGVAVCFGPNTWNFHDVVALLLEREAAVVIQGGKQLTEFARRCLQVPAFAAALGERAQTLVLEQAGAADRTINLLSELAARSEDCHPPHVSTAPAPHVLPKTSNVRENEPRSAKQI